MPCFPRSGPGSLPTFSALHVFCAPPILSFCFSLPCFTQFRKSHGIYYPVVLSGRRNAMEPIMDLDDLIFDKDAGGPSER